VTRILLADDHAVLREGLKEILAKAFADAEFGEAGDGAEAMALVTRETWDVVILDLTMPGRSGLGVLKEIKRLFPSLPVLILTMHPEKEYAVRAFRAGAAGFVPKRTASKELILAVKKALSGGRYVPPSLAETLAFEIGRTAPKKPHETLSDREHEVLCHLALGETATEVAAELNLSVHTVSTYRARILRKLRAETNADLTRYALENELIP
jgi:two-component system, NarL family, invasion response regulator UvrY